jgi:hypothetical protein
MRAGASFHADLAARICLVQQGLQPLPAPQASLPDHLAVTINTV